MNDFGLKKKSSLYFVLGLCLVLALTYIALERKTFNEIPDLEVAEFDKPNFLPDEGIPFIKSPNPKLQTGALLYT